jgi:tRNA (guanosine-2'-O-)-methyltransferase
MSRVSPSRAPQPRVFRLGLLVASVTQPFNVGTIVQSAAAFGVEQIWFSGNASLPDHPNAVKAAAGADRLVSWQYAGTAAEAAVAVREAGFKLIALELASNSVPIYDLTPEDDICLVIGAEDHGCPPVLLAAADSAVYIPQVGRVGSLNVAVATSIALAEITFHRHEIESSR